LTRKVVEPPRSPLERLADQVLEVPDIDGLARLLTGNLPRLLRLPSVVLLLWDRKLDTFLSIPPGETHVRAFGPADAPAPAPDARYLIAEGRVLKTPAGRGRGVLLPLMARSGLVGMLVLGPRNRGSRSPYTPREARLLSTLASRSALSVENQLYQRELIAAERLAALGTMAGMLAHDLRGPMTVIRGYAETFLEPDLPQGELKIRSERILEMVDRLERMTSETLELARGGSRLARRKVSLGALVEDLLSSLAREQPGLTLVPDVTLPAESEAALDVDKLRRVLGNLASNAREAMGGAGRLHVRGRLETRQGVPWLVLLVRDEGPGVPEAIRERVFDPFVTLGKKSGTGLGLAVARRFVEDHGGTLELLDKGPGAHFRLSVPL
jgi:signal transduction histidine kinase